MCAGPQIVIYNIEVLSQNLSHLQSIAEACNRFQAIIQPNSYLIKFKTSNFISFLSTRSRFLKAQHFRRKASFGACLASRIMRLVVSGHPDQAAWQIGNEAEDIGRAVSKFQNLLSDGGYKSGKLSQISSNNVHALKFFGSRARQSGGLAEESKNSKFEFKTCIQTHNSKRSASGALSNCQCS